MDEVIPYCAKMEEDNNDCQWFNNGLNILLVQKSNQTFFRESLQRTNWCWSSAIDWNQTSSVGLSLQSRRGFIWNANDVFLILEKNSKITINIYAKISRNSTMANDQFPSTHCC